MLTPLAGSPFAVDGKRMAGLRRPANVPHTPSASQLAAIQAEPESLLVRAGPGAGKTYCLIERVRFLVDKRGFDPARICVFTFTNKAAGEIASRLHEELGPPVELVKRGTIHSFCTELLREFGEELGLADGFGIADEDEQKAILRRLKCPDKMRKKVLDAFARHRFRGESMGKRFERYYDGYRAILAERNVLDFDMLVLRTAELLRIAAVSATVRARWDAVLVDEFQDLNPVQYVVIRELAKDHRHVFAVGDDEQSVYSWTGADPRVFVTFADDFAIGPHRQHLLDKNHRCAKAVLTLARRLIAINEPIFGERPAQQTEVESPFAVMALNFADDESETRWILQDLQRDRASHDGVLGWGDFALLYRTHKIGATLESFFLNSGVPCCLAQGRALADDDVVRYLIAALRVIAKPQDEIHRENFYQTVLPDSLFKSAQAWADEVGRSLIQQLEHMARTLPREHGDAKKIWRGYYSLQNLDTLGKRNSRLDDLVGDILSEKVGTYRTILEEHQEELSDPASHDEVVKLADRLQRVVDGGKAAWVPRLGGAEIAAKKMLLAIGVPTIELGGAPSPDAERVTPADFPLLGLGLGLFKTAQHMRTRSFTNTFRDFTAFDLETTDKNVETAEVVEIAAVRVRHGRIVDEYQSLVRPRVPINAQALSKHHISETAVADARYFESVWPDFRDFCGSDVLVAHNGSQFDVPILRRMAAKLPRGTDFLTYDTLPLARGLHSTSCKLEHLAKRYGIHTGQSHRALDDARALARLFPALSETRIECARKTALVNLLDHLAIVLALSDRDSFCDEARKIFEFVPLRALSGHSECLEWYRTERELCGDASIPDVDELVDLLGGRQLMERLRTDKSADERYPEVMLRLRSLMDTCAEGTLSDQICAFLDRVVLSKDDGVDTPKTRVNLLTLHSTKGLEFSRVYIVGVEDERFIPMPPSGSLNKREVEEARRLLYVGMTRAKDRLVMTRVKSRAGKPTGGHQFLDEMGLVPKFPPIARA
ncbi:MAG: UvrD-helicase domain-containing protein [Gemmatimonadaceae bacterium]